MTEAQHNSHDSMGETRNLKLNSEMRKEEAAKKTRFE